MDIEQQNGAAEKPSAAASAGISAKGLARRRFGKAGAGASGVLLTLVSQPGMACEICKAPSGSLSGGLKSHTGPAPACNGKLPVFWKNQTSWPGGCTTETTFNFVFKCDSYRTRSTFGAKTTTLKSILNGQKFDTHSLGMYLAAAHLNVLSGRVGFLTPDVLATIWREWQSSGYYRPTAGVKWDADQIVTYLTRTMDP